MRLVRLIRIICIIQCKIRIGREVCQMPMGGSVPNYDDGALGLHVMRESVIPGTV